MKTTKRWRVFILLALFLAASCPVSFCENRVYVLCYHTFLGKNNIDSDFSKEEFKAHLDYFAGKGFRFVSLSDVLENTLKGSRNILITIDDGNKTDYSIFFEVLKPMGIKPVLGVFPGIIEKKKYALTWETLKVLSSSGCTICSHGYYHEYLRQRMYEKRKKEFLTEIYDSKEKIEKKLGIALSAFVYPFGVVSAPAEEEVQKAGYKCAFALAWKPVMLPLDRNSDIYKLPRYMVMRTNWKTLSASIVQDANK